ncbi:OmpH family outer membrane protein [Pelagibacterales bacterium SAG-MED15]|nr:OmpH family outer membrane protein [Pelagibacterales bacterium SAG-MED15]
MKKKYFFFIVLIIFFNINTSKVIGENVVYIDMEKIMQKSKAGKIVIDKINKQKKIDVSKFQKIEKNLKEEEEKLIQKKNVLSEEEFNNQLNGLRIKITEYRDLRQKSIQETTSKRLNASADFAIKIKPILAEYASKNEIAMVIQKKNIIMGKSKLDITDEILKIVDDKINKLKID